MLELPSPQALPVYLHSANKLCLVPGGGSGTAPNPLGASASVWVQGLKHHVQLCGFLISAPSSAEFLRTGEVFVLSFGYTLAGQGCGCS